MRPRIFVAQWQSQTAPSLTKCLTTWSSFCKSHDRLFFRSSFLCCSRFAASTPLSLNRAPLRRDVPEKNSLRLFYRDTTLIWCASLRGQKGIKSLSIVVKFNNKQTRFLLLSKRQLCSFRSSLSSLSSALRSPSPLGAHHLRHHQPPPHPPLVSAILATFSAVRYHPKFPVLVSLSDLALGDSTQDAKDPSLSAIYALLGINVQDVTGIVGVTCTPITVIGGGGNSW